jgi:hypothetical protein
VKCSERARADVETLSHDRRKNIGMNRVLPRNSSCSFGRATICRSAARRVGGPSTCSAGTLHAMRLKIELPTTWAQADNPDGPATFFRPDGQGSFQVSWAEYRGGTLPTDVTADNLKQMAERFGQSKDFGKIIESSGGSCRYGVYGTAVFCSAEYPRLQVWFVSDGRDHIMATHICCAQPDPCEIAEVRQIAAGLALGPEHPPKPERTRRQTGPADRFGSRPSACTQSVRNIPR